MASRLQSLTRELGVSLVVSGEFLAALEREGADPSLAAGLAPRGAQVLRGRDHAMEVWAGP